MSVEMEYVFRVSDGESSVAVCKIPGGRWVVLQPSDVWDEADAHAARALGECLIAAADKCEELNRETKP